MPSRFRSALCGVKCVRIDPASACLTVAAASPDAPRSASISCHHQKDHQFLLDDEDTATAKDLSITRTSRRRNVDSRRPRRQSGSRDALCLQLVGKSAFNHLRAEAFADGG